MFSKQPPAFKYGSIHGVVSEQGAAKRMCSPMNYNTDLLLNLWLVMANVHVKSFCLHYTPVMVQNHR